MEDIQDTESELKEEEIPDVEFEIPVEDIQDTEPELKEEEIPDIEFEIPVEDISDIEPELLIEDMPDIMSETSDIVAEDTVEEPVTNEVAEEPGADISEETLQDIALDDIGAIIEEEPQDENVEFAGDMDLSDLGKSGIGLSEIPDISMDEDTMALSEDMALDAGMMSPVDDMVLEAGGEDKAGDNIDSMLNNLLDDLDVNGSIDDTAIDDSNVMQEETVDSMDGIMDMFGGEGAMEEQMDDNPFDNVGDMIPDTEQFAESEPEEQKEKKPGFFKRIFGNVVNDEIAEAEAKAKIKEEEDAKLKEEEAAKLKEEKEAKKAEKAEAKAAKKAEADAKKAEKAEAKAAKKAEKEAKKAEEAAAAEQEVVGKLNKAGVTIVIVFAVLILSSVIVGTNIFGYSMNKSQANKYFNLQKYRSAYERVIGTNLKAKDPDTYEKIITVMKVQQALDSYSSYENMKYYPDALNSLLKGLRRYDENIDKAVNLEAEGDMEVCKNKILSILKDEFGLSESEAYDILSLNTEDYSNKVVKIAMDKR